MAIRLRKKSCRHSTAPCFSPHALLLVFTSRDESYFSSAASKTFLSNATRSFPTG
jgi:hypothetical protein